MDLGYSVLNYGGDCDGPAHDIRKVKRSTGVQMVLFLKCAASDFGREGLLSPKQLYAGT